MDKYTQKDKIRGSLIGGAIGDALGYPVEFMSLAAIRSKYGKDGITDFELNEKFKAVVSDDTQMTLFTANGLMFGVTRWATHGVLGADLHDYVLEAYKEWYQTQTKVEDYNAHHTCWIRDIKELNVRRAPGNTCMSALSDLHNVDNNSKGCGGIMRVAPVALFLSAENERMIKHNCNPFTIEQIDKYAGDCAAITHKHPLGYLSAAIFVDVLYHLLNAEEKVTFEMVCNYVESALSTLMSIYTSKQEATALGELWYISKRAIELAKKNIEDSEAIRELGEGWVAEETWAIALYCVLKHLDSFEDAIIASVNHDGDSDSTGSVCGNLMGVIVGYDAIPEKYKTNIELKNVILAIVDDMIHGCNISEYHYAETADEKKWEQRYVFAKPMLKPLFNSYAVTDWLFAGEYPGDKDSSKLREKINQLDLFGITHIIDLTEEGELLPYAQLLPNTIKHNRFPIVDQCVPNSTESVRKLVQEIEEIHKNEPSAKVYIHCWGGVGRTGTIVCCFLAYELCANYKDTMSEFKSLWSECPKSKYRVSPENEMQLDFIRRYICKLKEKSSKIFTPERITSLAENEIFVFGSNLAGAHGGGAARLAYNRFGAVWGQGVGLQGQSYAIPTMQGGVETIKPYVDEFVRFAKGNRHLTFLVTRIGCGIAGFRDEEIAPLFKEALELENVILPKEFVESPGANPIVPDANETTWNSKDFISVYEPLMKKASKGDSIAYYKVKELRAQEYRSTIEIVNQGFYTTEEGKRVTFPDLTRMEHETTFYKDEFRVDDIPAREEDTKFVVRNVDCLEEGVRLCREGYNPAVLNMASRRNPGGGVMLGAGAQEETLFRRTNLFRSLYQFTEYFIEHVWYKRYITPVRTGERYPLNRDFGGVYTPYALLFREDEKHGYKLMDTPERLSFIAVAGINRPDLKDATHLADSMIEGTKNKMRTILRIGLRHDHDSLVLGALGCGAFCNPPSHIAKLFHEVFEEPEFKNKYRLISFAILDDHNAHRAHNPEGNYKPFVDEFENNNA